MLSIRKLAALDLLLHGPKLILAEFTVAVLLPLALGIWSLVRGHAAWQFAFGLYLLCLALNYLPLLIYAILFVARGSANSEFSAGNAGADESPARYAKQSLLLVVPLVIAISALLQLRHPVVAHARNLER